MPACKTCQDTHDDCGRPLTQEYFNSHKGNCMCCAVEAYAKATGHAYAQSGQRRKVKECVECGRNFKPKAKYHHCIYCWKCWSQRFKR